MLALSVDSKRGSELYRFDMSLMERLSSSGFPMSRIDVQRRMRPEISSLVRYDNTQCISKCGYRADISFRKTLYPTLIDHDLVKSYPDVRGFATNVYFLSHNHRENGGGDDNASKYNTFEVRLHGGVAVLMLKYFF